MTALDTAPTEIKSESHAQKFFAHLEKISRNDAAVKANLRRSLAFDAGTDSRVYPYVERFLSGEFSEENNRRRQMFYLAAGLWALRRGEDNAPVKTLARACADYVNASSSSESGERRFINLLDADDDQLPHRLRQIIALLKDFNLDFPSLLTDILYWNGDKTKTKWARDFYRNSQLRIANDEANNAANDGTDNS